MSDIKQIISDVEGSDAFASFNRNTKGFYIVHVFYTEKQGVELGYYDDKTDRIVVFETDPVVQRPPEEVFKESGTLHKLDITAVSVGLADVRTIARAYMKEHHPTHPLQQEILILQQADVPVWNCTLVTQTLNMLNLKIDATSGAILHEELRNIMDLRKT